MQQPKAQNKKGLLKLGYVRNLKNNEYLTELQNLLLNTSYNPTIEEINDYVENTAIEYFNKSGYKQDNDGNAITKTNAFYKRFKTNYKTEKEEDIYGWFYSVRQGSYEGVTWGTLKDFKKDISSQNMFHIGDFYFDEWRKGLEFLEDIAINSIPESWRYKNKKSPINHPILKSYLENIFERLKKETIDGDMTKIIYSENKKHIMFNTNLLDKFFHEILIVAEVQKADNGEENYFNPFRLKSITEQIKLKFKKDIIPTPPKFFESVNEVIFQTGWAIDKDFDAFTHIIEERQERFPDEYQKEGTDALARRLDTAIDYAIEIAQRNYKFIVPMYRPQTNSIQLLMPIYLNGTYNEQPNFALILTPDSENEIYTPETILPLDAVYQNARLIAKPDESWLNPETIL